MKTTNQNIKSDQLFAKLQECNSSVAILKVLEEEALAFEQYRKGGWNIQFMGRLKPIVEVLFRLSSKVDLKEGIVSVRLTGYNCSLRKFIIHSADISTSEGHIYWYWSPA